MLALPAVAWSWNDVAPLLVFWMTAFSALLWLRKLVSPKRWLMIKTLPALLCWKNIVPLPLKGTPWLSLVISAEPAVLWSVNVVVPPSKFWIKAKPAVLVLKKLVSPLPMLTMWVPKRDGLEVMLGSLIAKLEALALLKKFNV